LTIAITGWVTSPMAFQGVGAQGAKLADVRSGNEGALPCPAQDDDPHLAVAGEPGERLRQAGPHGCVQRVVGGGPIDRHPRERRLAADHQRL
jgi:hypothetical protein